MSFSVLLFYVMAAILIAITFGMNGLIAIWQRYTTIAGMFFSYRTIWA
jgi:hypothetical protein